MAALLDDQEKAALPSGSLDGRSSPLRSKTKRVYETGERKGHIVDGEHGSRVGSRHGPAAEGAEDCHGRSRRGQGGHDDDDDDKEEDEEDAAVDRQPNILDRVSSRVTSRSSDELSAPPDGGWLAWSQCLAGHLVIFNTWGWVNSFGSFQAYYTELLVRPPSDVAWIGSLNVFLIFFVGTLTGRLVDAGHFRPVFLAGTALLALGVVSVSVCTAYWHLMLAQGLCLGLAHGCLFCPALAVLAAYFDRRRALVLGIAACGSSTGGLVFPVMVRQLLPAVGFAWTVRAIGLVQLATMAVAIVLVRPRMSPRKTGPLIEWSAFSELGYSFYAAAAFFNFWGVYFAFFYVAAFSRDALRPGFSYPESLNLLLLLNGAGIIGRLAPSYAADLVGAVNVFIPASAAASGLAFGFIGVDSRAGLYAWVVFYGIAAAGIQSLFPAALSFLTTDLRRLGVRMGMVFTIVSFAVLTGPPVAGALIAGPGGYAAAKAFAGSSIAVGCGFLVAAKAAKMSATGQGWTGKT
ncbi:major facilitator superfamily protein [Hirsutella rhossiliensis]|uniref:Major facilitator superfamily domain-containing protein n=1 Tax=Hirsutella rhossiliensis TaxID=111463 RepID=A0A9P8SG62_9HYPO|nr:major facilitator superfamily domain-containing protein [Hirsutella rhossiliensis]KAH0960110.1 major facilitator superfamily domain-containing protein [Hirsutella rhossiliensis]